MRDFDQTVDRDGYVDGFAGQPTAHVVSEVGQADPTNNTSSGGIARIIEGLPEASRFALAGAGALTVQGVIERPTQDLDYFTTPGDDTAIVSMRDAVEQALVDAGVTCIRRRDLPTFVRLEVSDGSDTCQIDLAVDYRALPAEPGPLGPTLATKELGAGKVLAVFDRAEARDFLDSRSWSSSSPSRS